MSVEGTTLRTRTDDLPSREPAQVPTYSQEDFERLADAIGKDLADVLQYRNEFEAAATWYRLNIPPAERAGGPTLELRNRRPKKSKQPSELGKQRSKKSKTLSELRKKAKQVEAAAQKVLMHLGVRRLSEAPEGPGDREFLIFLASYSGSSEQARDFNQRSRGGAIGLFDI